MLRVLFLSLFFMFAVTGCDSDDGPAAPVVNESDSGSGVAGCGDAGSGDDGSGDDGAGDDGAGDDGAGDDGAGDDGAGQEETTDETTEVVASLGLINGADVSITLPDGTVITGATGTLDETGTITITHDGSYDGPVIVTVTGNDSATYFDESAGATLPMPATVSLRAFAPSLQPQIGVTILTELAAQVAATLGADVTAADITSINNTIRDTFAPGLSDILVAPALVSEANFTAQGLTNDDAGLYAATLAGLATMAAGDTAPALAILEDLIADLADGDIDGNGASGALTGLAYTPADFAAAFSSAVQTAVASLGDADLISAANAISLSLDSNVLQVVVNAGVGLPSSVTVLIDANDIDTGSGSGGDITGNFDLKITGEISTFGVATAFEATIQNIVAPSPSDTGAVQNVITETLAGVSGITNLQVTIVTNEPDNIVFDVEFSATQSGVSVDMKLRYEYTRAGSSTGGGSTGDSGSDSSGGDGTSSSDGSTPTEEPVSIESLGQICFFGGEPEFVDIPSALTGEFTLSYFESQSGAPYTANQQVVFAINVNGQNKLTIGGEVTLSNPVKCGSNGNEAIWKDSDNGLIYSLSSLNGSFNEINVNSTNGGSFLGQFSQ